MKKFIIASVLAFTFLFSGVSFVSANTDTSVLQNIMNQIEAIRGQLAGLAARSASAPVISTPVTPLATTQASVTTISSVKPVAISGTLRPGMSGDEVTRLQKELVTRGYLKESQVTGYYDEATKNAVAAFQMKNGLSADGVAGAKTASSLGWGTSWGEAGKMVESKNPLYPTVDPVFPSPQKPSHYHLINQRIVTAPIIATNSTLPRPKGVALCNNNEVVLGGGHFIEINAGYNVIASFPSSPSSWQVSISTSVGADQMYDYATAAGLTSVQWLNNLLNDSGVATVYAVCAEKENASTGDVHF